MQPVNRAVKLSLNRRVVPKVMTSSDETEKVTISRTTLLTFLIPFVAGGIYFSVLAMNFLNTLPQAIVNVYDRIYAIYLAFLDMGMACAIAAVTILCFIRQMIAAFKQLRSRRRAVENQQ